MGKTSKTYHMVDLYKWICSLFVIALHTSLFLDNLDQASATQITLISIFYPLFKAAVPFFFIISAYFAGKKIDWPRESEENVRIFQTNGARAFRMYLVWTLIYLIPTGVLVFKAEGPVKDKIWYLVLTAFLGGNGYCVHLWFLLGLGISFTIFLYTCGKKLVYLKWVFLASLLLYGVRALATFMPYDAPEGLFGKISSSFQFHLFSSLFYCVIGLAIAKYESFFLEKIPFALKAILLAAVYILACFHANKDFYAIPLHVILPVFILSVNLKGRAKVFLTLRKMSTYVFLIHLLVLIPVGLVYGSRAGTIPFLATSVISNVLAFLYIKVKDHRVKQA